MAQFIKSSEPQEKLLFVNLDLVRFVYQEDSANNMSITFIFETGQGMTWIYKSQELLDRDIKYIESLCKVAPDGAWTIA